MELQLLCCCVLSLTAGTLCSEHEPEVIKVAAEAGSDVILPCSLSTKENIESKLFDWRRDGPKEVFMYDGGIHYNNGRSGQDKQFKGRVSHFPDGLKNGNASIIIRNTQVADSGDYTCIFPRLQPERKFHITLDVGAAAKPHIVIVDLRVDWALLQCDVRGASPKPEVEWQDSAGNILPAEETQVSERGGIYDITLQTNVTKTDRYRCVATQEDIKHQTHAEFSVPICGAAAKPHIVTVDLREDRALLQCVVRGASPKPQLQWQDSVGNILPAEETQVSERGGIYDITLQTTVTKTDRYRCVATQEDIKHQTHAEIHLPISGNNMKEWTTGFVFGVLVRNSAILVAVAVVAALLARKYIKRRRRGPKTPETKELQSLNNQEHNSPPGTSPKLQHLLDSLK